MGVLLFERSSRRVHQAKEKGPIRVGNAFFAFPFHDIGMFCIHDGRFSGLILKNGQFSFML